MSQTTLESETKMVDNVDMECRQGRYIDDRHGEIKTAGWGKFKSRWWSWGPGVLTGVQSVPANTAKERKNKNRSGTNLQRQRDRQQSYIRQNDTNDDSRNRHNQHGELMNVCFTWLVKTIAISCTSSRCCGMAGEDNNDAEGEKDDVDEDEGEGGGGLLGLVF